MIWTEKEIFQQADRSLDIDESHYVLVFRTGSQFIEVTEKLGDPQYWKHLDNKIFREKLRYCEHVFLFINWSLLSSS